MTNVSPAMTPFYTTDARLHQLDPNPPWGAIKALSDAAFDELNNPFEQKLILRNKQSVDLPPDIEYLFSWMEDQQSFLSERFSIDLIPDVTRHYAGIFRYRPGDSLAVHVDAGIHPENGLRKHVTLVVYLGDCYSGAFELWSGESAAEEDPRLFIGSVVPLYPYHGRMLAFVNDDHAWHGARPNLSYTERIVATVSFLSTEVDAFANKRERAFFVPRPDETWDAETYRLRDLRATNSGVKNVYRVGRKNPSGQSAVSDAGRR